MPDNPQEQTEAKLLAYIEGELDESGRAEIERHILANPKHRTLLDELSAGRRLMRLLPRDIAPIELYENVQSQLERHVLLESTADVNPKTGNLRMTRWGQVRAAAAVVLLATGLGAMIIDVLPRRGARRIASTPPVSSGQQGAIALDESAFFADPAQPLTVGQPEAALRDARMASAADHVRRLPAVRDALGETLSRKFIDNPTALRPNDTATDAAPLTALAAGEPPRREPLYVVVASADVSLAREQVAQILVENGLTFSRVATSDGGQTRNDRAMVPARPAAVAKDKAIGSEGHRNETEDLAAAAAMPNSASPAVPNSALPASPVPSTPIAPTNPTAPILAEQNRVGLPPATSSLLEEVLIVRRVSRSRATQVLGAMNQPNASRFAMAYGGSPSNDPLRPSSDPLRPSSDPLRRSEKLKKADGTYRLIEKNSQADRMDVGGPGEAAKSEALRDGKTRPAVSMKQVAEPQRLLSDPSPPVGPAAAAGPIAAGAVPATLPSAAMAPVTKASDNSAIAAKPAAAYGGASAGAEAESVDSRAIEQSEWLELVYLDIRRNNRPLIQPTRISAKGTIFIAGHGEFALVGLTPAVATQNLNAAMKDKSPASKGVEIRRPVAEPAPLAQAAPAAPMPLPKPGLANGKGAPSLARPVTAPQTPTVTSTQRAMAEARQLTRPTGPRAPGIAESTPALTDADVDRAASTDDDLVDLVIVLQRDPAEIPAPGLR